MSAVETYDALVFGGGKGGKTLAMDLARSGQRVAMVERGMIGGSCINVACIPTKTLVRSAKVAELLRRGEEFGLRVSPGQIDMAGVRRHKRDVVGGMVALNRSQFEASGMTLLLGEGRFVAPKVLEVRLDGGVTRRLTAERVFLNTGTRSAAPDLPGMATAGPLTHVTALELDRLPEHLIVLGGGYIGMEFAQAFRRLGSNVTVIQRGPQLAPREDPDIAAAVAQLFRDEGIDVLLSSSILVVEGRSGEQLRVRVKGPDGERRLEGTDLLAAVGRLPNTDNIGLDVAGVQLDSRGFIRFDERLETTAAGVWALGDVAGSPMFTHVSLDDYRIIKANLSGGNRTTKDRLIPYCVFIDPELGRVGLNETEARQQGLAIKVARLPLLAVPRARTIAETRGLMKAVIDAQTDLILGFTMLGAEAGEVVAAVQMAMLGGLPYTALRDGILAHPTMAEGLNLLFATVSAPG